MPELSSDAILPGYCVVITPVIRLG